MSQHSTRDVWVVFNLETDPDNFKFRIALGPTVIDEAKDQHWGVDFREGRNENCSVFLQDDKGTTRRAIGASPKKLEIIPSVDRTVVDEPAIAVRCKEQLCLGLRLFRPQSFWVTAWDRRRDMQRIAKKSERYHLVGQELGAFCEFSQRLLDFHFERNRYRILRHEPMAVYVYKVLSENDAPVTSLISESDPEQAQFLARTSHLMAATDLFEYANEDWRLSNELRLVLLVIAAEALFTVTDHGITKQLKRRLELIGGAEGPTEESTPDFVARLCKVRDNLVHGEAYDPERWKAKVGDAVVNYGFPVVSVADLERLNDLVRRSLLVFIALREAGKAGIVQRLEESTSRVLEEANEFWGVRIQ